jgi:hypothetical protein
MSIITLSTSFDTNTGKRPKKKHSPSPRRNSSGPSPPFSIQRNSPLPRDKCKATTETEHREDLRRLEIYRQWFHEKIMATPNADAILVLPCGKSSRVEHRDEVVAYVLLLLFAVSWLTGRLVHQPSMRESGLRSWLPSWGCRIWQFLVSYSLINIAGMVLM